MEVFVLTALTNLKAESSSWFGTDKDFQREVDKTIGACFKLECKAAPGALAQRLLLASLACPSHPAALSSHSPRAHQTRSRSMALRLATR